MLIKHLISPYIKSGLFCENFGGNFSSPIIQVWSDSLGIKSLENTAPKQLPACTIIIHSLHLDMAPMWKSLVAQVLLPVIDLRQPVSIIFVKSQKKATYPFELEMKLKDSLKGNDYVS